MLLYMTQKNNIKHLENILGNVHLQVSDIPNLIYCEILNLTRALQPSASPYKWRQLTCLQTLIQPGFFVSFSKYGGYFYLKGCAMKKADH